MKNEQLSQSFQEQNRNSKQSINENKTPVENQDSQFQSNKEEKAKDIKTDIFGGLQVKCRCGKPAFLYCSSEGCTSHAAICRDQDAECSNHHYRCINLLMKSNLHKFLNSKIIKDSTAIQKTMKEVEIYIDKIIDEISGMKTIFDQQIKTFGMSDHQLIITQSILNSAAKTIGELQNSEQFVGYNFNSYNQSSFDQKEDWIHGSIKRFGKTIVNTKTKVQHYFQDIYNILMQLHIKFASKFSYQNYFKEYPLFKQIQSVNQNYSLELNNLVSILQKHMKIQSIRNLFNHQKKFPNTSSQELDQKRLYEAIETKSNLLFLLKNRNNKTYGLFTACKLSDTKGLWVNDEKNHSFIFSLNLGISENLTNSNFSLNYDRKNGKIHIGEFSEINNQILCDKNGATIDLGSYDSYYYPFAQIFLKKHQMMKNNSQTMPTQRKILDNSDEIDYKKIHGEERKKSIFHRNGCQIICLEVYMISVASFKDEKTQKIQSTPLSNLSMPTSSIFTSTNLFSSASTSNTNPRSFSLFGGN